MLRIYLAILVTLYFHLAPSFAEDKLSLPKTEVLVSAHDGNQLPLYQYPAKGDYLVLWISSGGGFNDLTTQSARDFARKGLEVWQIDFAEALLQTSGSNFLRNLDARYVADIIDAAHHRTGKSVVLFSQAYGAVPVLRGATLWQQRENHKGKLLGAILFSPDLVDALPALGQDPQYLPITRATDIPLILFQGGLRSSSWLFPRLIRELSSNNPNVYFNTMTGISGIFYTEDLNPLARKKLKALPGEMSGLIKLLENAPNTSPAISNYVQPGKPYVSTLDIKLVPFGGNPVPAPIFLKDVSGKSVRLDDYRGKVTVVNFWATWCPPCVAEIPSLNRLREQMQDEPFQLISINYAESPKMVNEFMKRVSVQFPVLMDLNGKVSKQWNVIGFPSTFVIDREGKIRYGVNAAIHWDTPEVVNMLKALGQ